MSETIMSVCPKHGQHEHEVCVQCFAIQQERVELESLPLRLAITTESQRRWVLTELAKGNGHSK